MKKEEKPNRKKQKNNENLKTIILLILIVICLAGTFAIYYFSFKCHFKEFFGKFNYKL